MLLELHDYTIHSNGGNPCRAVCKITLPPFGGGSRCGTLGLGGWSVDAPTIDPWFPGSGKAVATRGGGRLPTTSGLEKIVSPKGRWGKLWNFSACRILRVDFLSAFLGKDGKW